MKPGDVRSGLDADACRYLETRRRGIPRRLVAFYLDWPPAKAEAVRKRIERYLIQNQPPKEYSVAGTQIGNHVFSFWFPQLTTTCPQSTENGVKIEPMTNEDQKLHDALREARTKYDGLVVQGHAAGHQVDQLEAKLGSLRETLDHDAETALLDGRAPDGSLPKQIATAEKELAEARRLAKATAGAVTRQASNVERIENQVAERRLATFAAAVRAPQDRLNRALEEFLAAAVDVSAIATLHGFEQSYQYFPAPYQNDPLHRLDIRAEQTQLVWAALRLAARWVRSYDDAPRFLQPGSHPAPAVVSAAAIDPLRQRIGQERARVAAFNDQYAALCAEQRAAEMEADRIRYGTKRFGGFGSGPLEPGDQEELNRQKSIAEAKATEAKTLLAEREKVIDEIAKLEQEYSQKRTAAASAA